MLNRVLLAAMIVATGALSLPALRPRSRTVRSARTAAPNAIPPLAIATASRAGRGALFSAVIGAAGLLAVVGAFLGNGGLAVFTDTASVPANTFTTGTVDISTSPASALVTFSAMAPGDQVTNPLTVTNAGTLDLRYAVTSTTTENTLAPELDLTIKSGVATCTNAGFAGSGTVVYSTGDLGSTAGINVIGNPAQGSQAGDRTLAASGSEVLCFNVSLPLAAANAAQGQTTTATFAFAAEQTSNNP
jgi:hypothetical protein